MKEGKNLFKALALLRAERACSPAVKTSPLHGEDPRFDSEQAHQKASKNKSKKNKSKTKIKNVHKKIV